MTAVEAAGEFGAQYSDIDKVTSHHGDNHVPLAVQCAATDAGYPDLVIDDTGRPSLKQYRAPRPTDTALALEAALRERMPERTLLRVLARTAHWLEWYRRFSPTSGSDPKLRDPLFRYVITLFCARPNSDRIEWLSHVA